MNRVPRESMSEPRITRRAFLLVAGAVVFGAALPSLPAPPRSFRAKATFAIDGPVSRTEGKARG